MIGLFGVYAAYQHMPSSTPIPIVVENTAPVTPTIETSGSLAKATAVSKTTPVLTKPTTTTVSLVSTSMSGYKDGVYTGKTIDAYYGNVQVKVAVSRGVITNVSTLQSPGNRRQSISINNHALPVLQSEAVSSQTADINAVSGATYTSAAYKQSLASAISQAKA